MSVVIGALTYIERARSHLRIAVVGACLTHHRIYPVPHLLLYQSGRFTVYS